MTSYNIDELAIKLDDGLTVLVGEVDVDVNKVLANVVERTLENVAPDVRAAFSYFTVNRMYDEGKVFTDWFEALRKQDVVKWELLKNTIIKFVPEFETPMLQRNKLIIFKLVSNILMRLTRLNPLMADPTQSVGLVAIDEIELHLHPTQQQTIVPLLLESFPNVQFIMTTYSHFVLSTVDRVSLRMLYYTDDGLATSTPDFQTKGSCAVDILERTMNTYSYPDIQEVRDLNRFLSLITEGKHEDEAAVELFEKLRSHFGEDHHEMQKCEAQIRFQNLKAKFAQSRSGDGASDNEGGSVE